MFCWRHIFSIIWTCRGTRHYNTTCITCKYHTTTTIRVLVHFGRHWRSATFQSGFGQTSDCIALCVETWPRWCWRWGGSCLALSAMAPFFRCLWICWSSRYKTPAKSLLSTADLRCIQCPWPWVDMTLDALKVSCWKQGFGQRLVGI